MVQKAKCRALKTDRRLLFGSFSNLEQVTLESQIICVRLESAAMQPACLAARKNVKLR